MSDLYAVLGVARTASEAEIKSAWRALVKIHHTDTGGDGERLRAINEAHAVLGDPVKRRAYDEQADAKVVRSPSHVYRVGGQIAHGDLSSILGGVDEAGRRVVLKGLSDPANADLFDAEASALDGLAARGRVAMYLPTLVESFMVRDSTRTRRPVHVFERLDGWHTLVTVRSRMPRLSFEHGVWMFNRLLEGLGHVHRAGLVHGAIVPPHVMVYSTAESRSPWTHGAKIMDWCYSVHAGKCVKAIAPAWRSLYAPEILAKKPATPETDIYMAAKSVLFVLGGDPETMTAPAGVPDYLTSFLRGCTLGNAAARPGDAWALLDEFKDHMERHYGPRRYVKFTVPDTN